MGQGFDYSVFFESLEVCTDPWYTMADNEEVFNILNTLAMQYEFDEDTFFKAEQLWAKCEGLA